MDMCAFETTCAKTRETLGGQDAAIKHARLKYSWNKLA